MSCGRLYKSCGLLVESVESYRAAHALGPGSLDASRALAVVLTDLGAVDHGLVVVHTARKSACRELCWLKALLVGVPCTCRRLYAAAIASAAPQSM